jgi:nicotinamidase-related amidase
MADKLHRLLNPTDCVVALVDHQPQMFFGVGSHVRETIVNNATALAKSAKLFKVPLVLTTVAAKTFSGDLMPEIQAVFPEQQPIDRTTMNSWEDKNFKAAIEKTGRKKLVLAGLWTEVCVCFPLVDALADGYEVYFVADACGDITAEAHERAVQRAIQAGGVPMTTLQVMFEWQRDWARAETYQGCMDILMQHAAYGIGVRYAKSILGEHASEAGAQSAAE